MSQSKVLQGFFVPGVQFVCRFCTVSLGDFKGKTLQRNSKFSQAKVKLSTGQEYQFNGCKECLTSLTPEKLSKSFLNDGHPKELLSSLDFSSLSILKKELI